MQSNGEFQLLSRLIDLASASSTDIVMCDIGANLGVYSEKLLAFAKAKGLSKRLSLFIFEPNPTCLPQIEKTIANLRPESNTTLVQKIVTNHSGETSFFITGETSGSSSLRIDEKTQTATRIDALCITLDDFCRERNIEHIFFAKVDTEGNDMTVLEGAKGMLERGAIDFLQVEYNHRWILFRNYLKDVFELTNPLGYKVAKVTSEGLEVYPGWHFELEVFWEGNYLISKDFSTLGLPMLESAIFS